MTAYTARQLGPYAFVLVDRHGQQVSNLFVGAEAQKHAESARDEANEAGHIHDMPEHRMSDCPYGCKVYRCCWCDHEVVSHSATYGCPEGSTP